MSRGTRPLQHSPWEHHRARWPAEVASRKARANADTISLQYDSLKEFIQDTKEGLRMIQKISRNYGAGASCFAFSGAVKLIGSQEAQHRRDHGYDVGICIIIPTTSHAWAEARPY